MKNNILKSLFIFILLIIGIYYFLSVNASSISSTINGGNWNDPNSWEGGVIPGVNDDVVIKGPIVLVGNQTVNDLFIENSCSITNYSSYGNHNSYLDIKGNITNNGTIYNTPGSYGDYDGFYLNIKGNIINNGIWNVTINYLYGENSKNYETLVGYPIGGGIILNDNFEIVGNLEFLSNINLNGKTLTLNGNTITSGGLTGVGNISGSGGKIISTGSYSATLSGSLDEFKFSTGILTLNGNIKVNRLIINTGVTIINYQSILDGNLINNGTLTNNTIYGNYYSNLDIKGNVLNNGNLINSPWVYGDADYLYLKVKGDIINNGIWNVATNYLYGENSKNYETLVGYPIGGGIILNDNFEIVGNPEFLSNTNLNGKTLTLNGNTITLGGLTGVGNISGSGGKIISTGNYSATLSGSLDEFRFLTGTLVLNGNIETHKLIVDSGVNLIVYQSILNGNLINSGSITNNAPRYDFYTANLDVKGNILNNGNIYTTIYGRTDYLDLKTKGNILNNGTITANLYLKWDSYSGATNYSVYISGQGGTGTITNEYLVPQYLRNYSNQYWYAMYDNGILITDKKCFNIAQCIKENGDTNPIGLKIVNYLNTQELNSNLLTQANINAGPKLLFASTQDTKSFKTSQVCKIPEKESEGDPVNLAAGNFDYENTLMSYNSEGLPFEFKIKYKNQAYYNGPIGNNFDFNYNIYLTEDSDGNINYHDGKLGAFRFTKTATGFLYNDTINASLTMSGINYEVKFDNQTTYKFGLSSKIENITDNYGNQINFTYNEDKQLTKITDTLLREYTLTYYEHSRIKDITDFTGNKVEFIYFGTGETEGSEYDLKNIKMTNSSKTREISFTYTIGLDFDSSHNIVKLIDSEGNTYVENTYDTNDRVLIQKYGSGTISYNYTMSENGQYIAKNSVTDKGGNIIDYYYDNRGNTIKKIIIKSSGNQEYNYVYDDKSNLIQEIQPLGNGTSYIYDENNNRIEVRIKKDMSQADSNEDIVSTAVYDKKFNKPLQTISPRGQLTNYTYDTNGNLLTKKEHGIFDINSNELNIEENYTYNNKGQLIKQTNAKGLETTFEYGSGNLTKITKGVPHPNPLLSGDDGDNMISQTFEYDPKGNLVKTIDPKGNETTLTYDEFNLVTKKLTPELLETNYTYNKLNKKTNEQIILGESKTLETNYEYDILDNITKVIQDYDEGKTILNTKIYDENSRIIEERLGSGAIAKYTYDENGLVTKKTIQSQSEGSIETNYSYDLNARLVQETNPRGKFINYEYDLFDRLIKKINPDGSNESYEYDNEGNIEKVEKYSSNNTLLSKEENIYDKRGKVITNKKYLLEENKILTSYFKYDENGNLVTSIDTKGNTTSYTYDEFDRNIEVIDSKGNKVINTYDKNNNVIEKQVVQSNGKTTTTSYVYDKDNRLISETNSLNKSKSYSYNKLNQVISITDEKGNITNYSYNYVGKVKSSSQPSPEGEGVIVTSYSYDERGNMLSVTDSKGNITNYEYNDLNQLVKQIYADGKYVSYSYDKNGNILSKTDLNGTLVNYIYDDLDRLITKNINKGAGVEGVTSENYTYDSLGRLVEGNDSNNHKLSFNYDSLNRLIQENQSGSLVGYTYDDNGNLTSITSSNNKVTSYSYDELNRVFQIKQNNQLVTTYSYTGILLEKIKYGNNTTTTKTYDELNRLLSINNGIKNYTYTYDDVNNITSNNYKNYTYDDLYRLTNVKDSNLNELESFSYDNVGNRTNNFNSNIGSGASYDYTTNNLNQYTSLSGGILKNYTYDNNGNIKEDGNQKYYYDYKNRLVRVTNISGTQIKAEYRYDVLGRRYQKTILTKITSYVYSGENILQESYIGMGPGGRGSCLGVLLITINYINGRGIDNILGYDYQENDKALQCTLNRYYVYKDNKGTIDGVKLDTTGMIFLPGTPVPQPLIYEYDEYGKAYVVSGTSKIEYDTYTGNTYGNKRLFTGREYDKEIGLYYFRARYYDSKIGRFISRDPIDIADDVNLYGYVGNNPVMFVDLMGKSKEFNNDVTDKVLSIFEGANKLSYVPIIFELVMHDQTGNSKDKNGNNVIGLLNLKERLNGYADKDGYATFNGVRVHKSNFGNLLFGFNIQNSLLITKDFGENKALEKEKENYKDFGKYTDILAELDEEADREFYRTGYQLAKNFHGTKEEKIQAITNQINIGNANFKRVESLNDIKKREIYKKLGVNENTINN